MPRHDVDAMDADASEGALASSARSLSGAAEASASEAPRWFRAQQGTPKAVTLVLHGLNMKPSRMNVLCEELAGKGVDSFRATLTGHDGNLGEFKQVTRERWLADASAAYDQAAARARELGVPLHLVGFSLGGLIGCDLSSQRKDVHFDKMVLLAPAVATRPTSRLVKLLSAFRSLVIPSASPKDYQANRGTPVAAYNALYDSVDGLGAAGFRNCNVPTLVFVDPKDELVSPRGIDSAIARYGLDQWKQIQVSNRGSTLPRSYHHLITEPAAVGDRQWRVMQDAIDAHLAL